MHDETGKLLLILERLCSFNTISNRSNLELVAYCRDLLKDAGFTLEILPDESGQKANLHAVKGNPELPGLMLAGHTDVVPVEGQDWDSEPFELVREGDILRARGVTDMKGFVAAALTFATTADIGPEDRPLHIVLTYDEETGCFGARDIVPYLQKAIPQGTVCLLGEPTGLKPVVGHKGILGQETIFHGSDGHASRIRFGSNAIHFAGDLITYLKKEAENYATQTVTGGYATPHSTIQIGVISGGIARNMIANKCRLEYEFRNVPESSSKLFLNRLNDFLNQTLLPDFRQNEEAASITTKILSAVPSFRGKYEGRFLSAVQSSFLNEEPREWDGVTEAGYYVEAGMDVIVCGPGDITQPHKPNESASLIALMHCIDGLKKLMKNLPDENLGIGRA